jgi:hypothetical protein
MPNLYSFIQKKYWNAGFMNFLNRDLWGKDFVKGLPTNILAIYVFFRSARGIGLWHLVTLGVFRKAKMQESEEYDIF